VDITANKINKWIQVDRRRKIRADRRNQFFGRVRKTFIYLFLATMLVLALNHYTEIQSLAYAKLVQTMKHSPNSDKLRQSAVNYEQQVDEITK
jgi:cell division protein FtsL